MFHLTLMFVCFFLSQNNVNSALLRPHIQHLFEGFSILKRDEKIECIYNYYRGTSLSQYYDFIFPCDCPKDKSEEYVIVISNSQNSRSFLMCLYSKDYKLYLCIHSYNPWFEILSKLLRNLCSKEFLINPTALDRYLNRIYMLENKEYVVLPACIVHDKDQELLKSSLKYPFVYDKYIQEYLTAIKATAKYNKQLWIEVFWGMLLERPVIFMSKRYQKLTSSLIAAIFFIHPLSWLHKIVSIIPKKSPELLGMNCCMLGIHSCMEPFLGKAEYWNEALLVDLDKGEARMVGACDNEKETKKRFKVPKYIKKFFSDNLPLIDESICKSSPNRIRNIISNVPWDIDNKEEQMFNEYKKGFHIYSLLFRTVIAILIGHYRECISESDDSYHFDQAKFIDYNTKISDFLQLLVHSQCFDSFIDDKMKTIQNNQDLIDRFDRERFELSLTEKSRLKKLKLELIQKKIITVITAKSEEDLTRKEKISTLPNPKKKKRCPINSSSSKNSTFFSAISNEKDTSSLSSSSISLNVTNKMKDVSDCNNGNNNNDSGSLASQFYKTVMSSSSKYPNPDFCTSSPLDMQVFHESTTTRSPRSLGKTQDPFKTIPERPTNLPFQRKPLVLPKDFGGTAGRVKDMIHTFNEKDSVRATESVLVVPRYRKSFSSSHGSNCNEKLC